MLETRRAVRHLKRADPALARIIDRVGPCRMVIREGTMARYESLVRAIVWQQLHGRAAETIYGRLLAACGGALPAPAKMAEVGDGALRAAGLSRGKLAALRDLSARATDGRLALERLHALDEEAAIAQITQVRGLGVWSAQMFLMFHLGRPDVLPASDFGIRRGFMKTYGMKRMPAPVTIERKAEAWRPWRSIGSWYLWRATEF